MGFLRILSNLFKTFVLFIVDFWDFKFSNLDWKSQDTKHMMLLSMMIIDEWCHARWRAHPIKKQPTVFPSVDFFGINVLFLFFP